MKTNGVEFKAKKFFFDRKLVQDILGKKSAKALGKAGAFVQRRARSSLRRRKKTSAPGQPPSVHSQDRVATLKNILFAYEPRAMSVVIGPVRLNQVENNAIDLSRTTVPELHEFGGTASIFEVSHNNGRTWRRFDRRRNMREGETFRRRHANYPARPFMQPALAAEAPKFPSLWFQVAG